MLAKCFVFACLWTENENEANIQQCSPEVPAAGVFAGYSHFKCWLRLQDKTTEYDSSISLRHSECTVA